MDPAPREGDPGSCAAAPSRACGPATPTSPASSSTIATTRATSSSARRRARPRRASRPARSAGACSPSSACRSAATSCTSAASTPRVPDPLPDDINAASDESPLRTLDRERRERDDRAHRRRSSATGNTLGGICEVVCRGLPVGLGSHVSWDRKLDGRLGAAHDVHSGGEGRGDRHRASRRRARPGSEVHDEIEPAPGRTRAGNVRRKTNRAGGLEGGMTTGEPLVRARGDEADQHAHAPARHRRCGDGRGGGGDGRAERRHGRAGDGRHRRGDGGVRARAGACSRSSAATRSAEMRRNSTATFRTSQIGSDG